MRDDHGRGEDIGPWETWGKPSGSEDLKTASVLVEPGHSAIFLMLSLGFLLLCLARFLTLGFLLLWGEKEGHEFAGC